MDDKITLLYVDDEYFNLKLFELNFKNKYNVITADSGIYALELLKKHPETKVVVSDMRMPEMNGIQFIQEAKKDYSEISYFILTGFEINEEISEAVNNKLIKKYLKKPFNKQEIEQSIAESLN